MVIGIQPFLALRHWPIPSNSSNSFTPTPSEIATDGGCVMPSVLSPPSSPLQKLFPCTFNTTLLSAPGGAEANKEDWAGNGRVWKQGKQGNHYSEPLFFVSPLSNTSVPRITPRAMVIERVNNNWGGGMTDTSGIVIPEKEAKVHGLMYTGG